MLKIFGLMDDFDAFCFSPFPVERPDLVYAFCHSHLFPFGQTDNVDATAYRKRDHST